MDHHTRLKKLRHILVEKRLDFLVVSHLPNIRYLCGFTGSAAALLVGPADAVLFTDGRYTAQARLEVKGARVKIGNKAPTVAAGEWLHAKTFRSPQSVGTEAEVMTIGARKRLGTALGHGFRLRPVLPVVERLRMIKDRNEVERIRAAVRLGSELFQVVLDK